MKKKVSVLFILFLGVLFISTPISFASEMKSDVGIIFSEDTAPSKEKPDEIDKKEKIKILPQTGESNKNIIIVSTIGIVFIFGVATYYVSSSRRREGK